MSVVVVLLAGSLALAAIQVAGPITAVDVEARTLTVRDAERGDLVLTVDPASRIVLDGEEGALLDDLFAGDDLVSGEVREQQDGRLYLVSAAVVSRAAPEDPD